MANCNAAGKATLCFIVSQFVYELGKGKTATKITSADEFENYANTLPEESNFSRNVVSAVKQFGKAVKNIPDGELPNFLRARTTPLFTGNREKFGDFIATYLTTYYKLMAQSLSTMFWNDVVGKTVNFSLISTAIELSFNLIRSPGMSLINFFENLNRYLDIVEPPPTEEEKAKAKEAREAKKAKSDAKTEPKVETAKETPKTEPKVEPKPTVEVSSTKRVTLKPAKK